ncbi:MAG: GH25 family lysozyme [Candidatus Thermoplasmatota archaeon]|nr:GH25 family lysozyme [Candidatus Thermoplasmatota archaeon]
MHKNFTLALFLALVCSLVFNSSQAEEQIVYQPQEFVEGIDVSHWQGEINWDQVYGSGKRFAFVKASEGISYIDPYFEENMVNGRAAGMLMGAYHFARPLDNSAVDEARFFISVIDDYLTEGYMRPTLDIEVGEGEWSYISDWVHEFMNAVRDETGITPVLYVNSYYANNLDPSLTQYSLWIARYTHDTSILPDPGVWPSWDFWQWSDRTSCPGIEGYVDGDVFNGDIPSLRDSFEIGRMVYNVAYDRDAAYRYASRYWDEVCSDCYFWYSGSNYEYLAPGTSIKGRSGYDCAHFVSCCIGQERNYPGGGLPVPSRTATYGEPGADRLCRWVVNSGYGSYKSSVNELVRGDVIGYDWDGGGYIDHVALYLGNGCVAAHTSCVWNANWNMGAARTTFVHINA